MHRNCLIWFDTVSGKRIESTPSTASCGLRRSLMRSSLRQRMFTCRMQSAKRCTTPFKGSLQFRYPEESYFDSLRSKWPVGEVREGASRSIFTLTARDQSSRNVKNGAGRNRRARSRRPIFIAIFWGRGQLVVFSALLTPYVPLHFCSSYGSPRSRRRTKMGGMLVARALKNSQTDLRRKTCYFGDRTLSRPTRQT